jgi:pimeloyl-ACP methyl ester carboxylesterase/DNA-binding CsgD family transcriptional regulator
MIGLLTEQEQLVADAVARGRRNREVAADLHLSPRTVEAHLGRIYRKLGISSRSELAAMARDLNADAQRSDMPTTRYAKAGDLSIAYQVVGDGPCDIVLIPGLASHIEILWEQPQWRRFVARIAKLGRFIVFDKRGTGLSDPLPVRGPLSLEQRMEDVTAVMDAAGSSKAVLLGISEGGPMSLYLAAAHPERVAGLLMYGSTVPCTDDGPELTEQWVAMMEAGHGTGYIAGALWPTMAQTEEGLRWLARFERYAVSPAMLRSIVSTTLVLDPTWVLPAIRVPTTVVHGRQDPALPYAEVEAMMPTLPHARFVPIDVVDHVPWGDIDLEALVAELEALVEGADWRAGMTHVLVAVLAVTGSALADRPGVEHWVRTMGGDVMSIDGGDLIAAFRGPSTAVQCAAMVSNVSDRISVGVAVGEARWVSGRLEGPVAAEAVRLAASADGRAVVSAAVRHLTGSDVELEERPDGTFQVSDAPFLRSIDDKPAL